jgi:hypothetical protein
MTNDPSQLEADMDRFANDPMAADFPTLKELRRSYLPGGATSVD